MKAFLDFLAEGSRTKFQPRPHEAMPAAAPSQISSMAEALPILARMFLRTPTKMVGAAPDPKQLQDQLALQDIAHSIASYYALEQSIDQKRLARLAGFAALALPVTMLFGAWLLGSCQRDSISHYYFDQHLGSWFVGMLIFIAGFMISYRGGSLREDVMSSIAGLGAVFVAIAPTTGPGCDGPETAASRVFATVTLSEPPAVPATADARLFELFGSAGTVHSIGAALVFAYLAYFCWSAFRRIIAQQHEPDGVKLPSKYRRNVFYGFCSITIGLCAFGLGANALSQALWGRSPFGSWNALNMTFWLEGGALWAFAFAWLAKGRLVPWLNDPGQSDNLRKVR